MKRLLLTLSLALVALSGCAQMTQPANNPNAEGGASGVEQTSPFPKTLYQPNFQPA